MKFLLGVLTVGLLAAPDALGGEVESRVHSTIVSADQETVLYYVTNISRESELVSSDTYLLQDAQTGQQFVLTTDSVWHLAETSWRIYHPESQQRIAIRSDLPFEARTRSGALAEFEAMTAEEKRSMTASEAVVEAAGVERPADDDEWQDPVTARRRRSELRANLNPSVLEGLERMRVIATRETEMISFCDLLGRILYNMTCDEGLVRTVPLPADCSFDASFGYACSRQQRLRVQKAESDGTPLTKY